MLQFRNPGAVPSIFMVCALTTLLALGFWQVERLAWKRAQIAAVTAAAEAPVLSAPAEGMDYRRATFTGHYREKETLRFIAAKSGGFVHLTPLVLTDGTTTLLVSRGWVAGQAPPPPETGVVTVSGVMRPLRGPRRFSPPNAPDKNIWFVEDLPAMRLATGHSLLPYVLETGPLPRLRNDHLGYAITWFTLAALGVFMFAVYCRARPEDVRSR